MKLRGKRVGFVRNKFANNVCAELRVATFKGREARAERNNKQVVLPPLRLVCSLALI